MILRPRYNRRGPSAHNFFSATRSTGRREEFVGKQSLITVYTSSYDHTIEIRIRLCTEEAGVRERP